MDVLGRTGYSLGTLEGMAAALENALQDPDEAILDRILERGRLIQLDGPSLRTKHLDEPDATHETQPNRPEFLELAGQSFWNPHGTNSPRDDEDLQREPNAYVVLDPLNE